MPKEFFFLLFGQLVVGLALNVALDVGRDDWSNLCLEERFQLCLLHRNVAELLVLKVPVAKEFGTKLLMSHALYTWK